MILDDGTVGEFSPPYVTEDGERHDPDDYGLPSNPEERFRALAADLRECRDVETVVIRRCDSGLPYNVRVDFVEGRRDNHSIMDCLGEHSAYIHKVHVRATFLRVFVRFTEALQ